jgi:hypothetical protein
MIIVSVAGEAVANLSAAWPGGYFCSQPKVHTPLTRSIVQLEVGKVVALRVEALTSAALALLTRLPLSTEEAFGNSWD